MTETLDAVLTAPLPKKQDPLSECNAIKKSVEFLIFNQGVEIVGAVPQLCKRTLEPSETRHAVV